MGKRSERDSKSPEMLDYYARGLEDDRLSIGPGPLEFVRTKDILDRYLPSPPAVVLDVGGGPGAYALWLLKKGYEVHLIDPIPLHVEQAVRAFAELPGNPTASAKVGSALKIEHDNAVADAVLFLGPLYHLTEKNDRLTALGEAYRVLRPGGLLFAAAISRFASLLDGLDRNFIEDPAFVEIIKRDLRDGQHRNPTGNSDYFTTAFFHHPDELESEVLEAGFQIEAVIGIEGPGWALGNLDRHLEDPRRRALFLDFLRMVESEKSLLGMSPHLIAVAKK